MAALAIGVPSPYHYFRRNTLTIKLNCMKRKERTMATIDTVKEVLVENLDLEAEKITEEATLESLGIDSLDMSSSASPRESRRWVSWSRTSIRCNAR